MIVSRVPVLLGLGFFVALSRWLAVIAPCMGASLAISSSDSVNFSSTGRVVCGRKCLPKRETLRDSYRLSRVVTAVRVVPKLRDLTMLAVVLAVAVFGKMRPAYAV